MTDPLSIAQQQLLAVLAIHMPSDLHRQIAADLGIDLELVDVSIEQLIEPLRNQRFPEAVVFGVHSVLIDELLLIKVRGFDVEGAAKCVYVGAFMLWNSSMSECGAVPSESLGAIVGGALRLPVPCQLAVVNFLLALPGPRHVTDNQHYQTLLPVAIAGLVLPAVVQADRAMARFLDKPAPEYSSPLFLDDESRRWWATKAGEILHAWFDDGQRLKSLLENTHAARS